MIGFNLILMLCIVHLTGLHAGADWYRKVTCSAPYKCVSTSSCIQNHGGAHRLENVIIFECRGGRTGDENVCCPPVRHHTSTKTNTVRPAVLINTQLHMEEPSNVDLKEHKNFNLLPNQCGFQVREKVSQGQDAGQGQFPWMALLGYSESNMSDMEFHCGGTLINDRYILTAAHCVNTTALGFELKRVRLGELDLNGDPDCYYNGFYDICADNYAEYDVERVTSHPAYNLTSLQNDIALVRLKTRVPKYTDYIGPICLPFDLLDVNGGEEEKYTVAGWGKTDYRNDSGSSVLKYATVLGTSIEDCNIIHSNARFRMVNELQLCATGSTGEDACKGDSGGPLMHITIADGNPRMAQIGVVSFGLRSCGSQGIPSIYTRVSAYLGWILDNIAT